MVKNDFLNGFVVTSTETLWLHRQVADMDYVGSLVATEQEYMEQIGRFVEKVKQIAEATVHVNGGELHASSEQEDMYAAIDILVDKLARQLNKHKDKLKQH